MRRLFTVSTLIALIGAAAVQAVTIQKNMVFPDTNLIDSQLVDGNTVGVRDIFSPDIEAKMGQTFTLTNAAAIRAITLKQHTGGAAWGAGTHVVELWIGQDTDGNVSNFVAGATSLLTSIDLANRSFAENEYVTINLDSDVNLPAGDYAFQFRWTTTDASHQWFVRRADGDGTYAGGGVVFVQTLDGTPVSFPTDGSVGLGIDLVFGLHSSVIGTVPGLTADSDEISMLLAQPANRATGTVGVAYTADSTMDISITISDESHPGSFSVLSANPQTLTAPSPSNTVLAFQFDNTVSNLGFGATATGLVTIAWNETGSAVTNELVLPIHVITGYAPDANNVFTPVGGSTGTWGSPANWDLGRVPGTLGADRALIQGSSGLTCNMENNFTGAFPFRAWVRTPTGISNVLNIGADFKGLAEISIGQAVGQYGIANQTAGAVQTSDLKVGDPAGTAVSNSCYNLTGGTLLVTGPSAGANAITLSSTGVLDINGGALSIDQGPKDLSITTPAGVAPGLLKVQSGSLTSLGTVASDVLNVNVPVEISGGTVTLNGQNKFKAGLKVIGDGATISIDGINTPAGTLTTTPEIVWEMGPTGVSEIDGTGSFAQLGVYAIVIDGANYAGGSGTFPLFKSTNLASTSTVVTVTNFAPGVSAVVTQVKGIPGNISVTITVPGYAGWIGLYGLSGPVAAPDADYEPDGEDNFYEYAFGGDPTNAAIQGYVPAGKRVKIGGTDYFEYVYPRRIGATDLAYIPEFATDLVVGNWSGAGVVEIDTGTLDEDMESVTNRVNMTGIPEGFMHLLIDTL